MGSVTVTGLTELRQQIEALPREVTLHLRAVAFRKSREVKERARAILLSKIHGHNTRNHQHTADSIVILEEEAKKQFVVTVENPDQPNLGLYLERGTVNMTARPFMRPAADEIDPSYKKEMLQAAESVVSGLGKL